MGHRFATEILHNKDYYLLIKPVKTEREGMAGGYLNLVAT
jgi:hypothetical protein